MTPEALSLSVHLGLSRLHPFLNPPAPPPRLSLVSLHFDVRRVGAGACTGDQRF